MNNICLTMNMRQTFTTNPLWMKVPASGTQTAATYYTYQNDHLGTPMKLLNQSGVTVWSATYDAFGRATVDPASTVSNNLRFPGQYYDAETGMHYNWMRFYDPTTGRYVTSDPVGLRGGINEYGYVDGNPLSFTDPEGLAPTRNFNGGNAAQRRFANRHQQPNIPRIPIDDNASSAAGYFDDEGEYVCLRWSCPANQYQCSKGDTKRSTDFLPSATDPANPPSGCTCDERRFRLKNEPKIDPYDWLDQMRDARAKTGKPIKWLGK